MALHWTQTKAGKKKMSVAQKKRWAKARKKTEKVKKTKKEITKQSEVLDEPIKQDSKEETASDIKFENTHTLETALAIGYATFTTWINLYSEFTGISESSLTRELGNALLSKASR